MRAFTIVSALIVVAASGVAAAPRGASAILLPRQSSDVPAECQEQCATASKVTACGEAISCLCTTEIGQGIVDCGTCGFNHQSDPSTADKGQFQAGIDDYVNSCGQAGYPVGPFSIATSSGRRL